MTPGIVPPYLLARLAEAGDARFERAAVAARRTLLADEPLRAARITLSIDEGGRLVAELSDAPNRTVADAGGAETLPGRVVRREGEPATGDAAADEAYEGLGATFALFSEVYGRNSIDGDGMPLEASVHYGEDYDNAFWNGERMVFGDGDGEVFGRFTASLSVIGHELAHGVTEHTAGLVYRGQSGALNESVSDVFGALVEQRVAGQTADEASWLIGEGLFTPEVEGSALRSMKAPGTAYDDDVLGKDPQPGHMDDYIETSEDDGGVHLNSGIPNRAFHLAAVELGGEAWERAGRIWYDALTAGGLSPTTDFAGFAAATAAAATARYGEASAETAAVRAGWAGVGVEIDDGSAG
ncbi:M4 family metallopeptidase [Homoserinibacter sp. YIM 151385]|uniref:M4 family metallopeptidase n=1 Tax=Homoserinibacter sp. YIM 151385 TaxID=2985506 RepID=UPI0022F00405|nr:M4 family metallopeptidase [Homoserinibacter sp. YIM 151385]WBU38767.1 M4 family metallopeptidase [Homoserinibacter sp. YIM 151385]